MATVTQISKRKAPEIGDGREEKSRRTTRRPWESMGRGEMQWFSAALKETSIRCKPLAAIAEKVEQRCA
ncbi:hypothetical protein Taro_057023 [Colocasia esculenta]|uniref:Uncharacterized protein n=1 Tax=Colocasia esculenta TaxID=4460 RepID=A0A843XXV4_COLES|nr:hypothetical protein [Colocasia esculenta]